MWAVLETLKQQQQQQQQRHRDPGQGVGGRGVGVREVGFPACWAVEPRRVARFWSDGDGTDGPWREGWENWIRAGSAVGQRGKRGRGSTRIRQRAADVKKEKIGLVRSWLETGARAPFELSFVGEAEKMRDMLLTRPKRNSSKKSAKDESAELREDTKAGKLDDLADCFLQAATWVQWEWNRRRIMHSLDSRNGG